MSRADTMIALLTEAFHPEHLSVENESGSHSVPKGSETHFKIVVVSDAFLGKGRVERHQLVYGLFRDQMNAGLHAVSIVAKTPEEWQKSDVVPPSPACLGGSASEAKTGHGRSEPSR